MEAVPSTLYKYLVPERVDVLDNLRIRFTQPSRLNDPFEFNLSFQQLISTTELHKKLHELNPEEIINQSIAKLPPEQQAAINSLPAEKLNLIKLQAAEKFFTIENLELINNEYVNPHTNRIRDEFYAGLDKNIGVLSLSADCSIAPMWASYTDNSKGFVIGLKTANQFFNRKRSQADEFYHLRKVVYENMQTVESVSKMTPHILIQKSESWAYESEWRMLLPLSTANDEITTPTGEKVFLFDIPADAISQIIFGLNTKPDTINMINNAISKIDPDGNIQAFRATKGLSGFQITPI